MKILHAAETIKGGIASYLRDLLPLQARDFGPAAVTVVIPASQRRELPVVDGVRVVCFDDTGPRPLRAVRLALACSGEARRMRPTLVHLHSTFAGALARPWLAARLPSVPLVYCPHGWAWDRLGPPLQRRAIVAFERLQSRWTDAVVCISRHEAASAEAAGLPAAKLHVVLNGVGRQRPEPRPIDFRWKPGLLRVVFMGRLDRQKGFDVLVEALRALGPVAHVAVIGASVLGDTRIAMPPNVESLGWLVPEEVAYVLRDADVVVVPSRWEGFGLVAIEAMRAGVAVLASSVGGLPESVVDGETGRLVPPGDAGALAAALRDTPPEAWRRMGRAGQARFERLFDIERVHAELRALYETL